MNGQGAKVWFIPDGYLVTPIGTDRTYKNHEAICIINTATQDAHLLLDLYFADRPPQKDIAITIPAERCYHVRLDNPDELGGFVIPFDTPYGVRIRSDVPIIVQYSRMYHTTHNISLMTTMAHPVDTD
ncbi:MAG: hypothetical protein HXY41_13525 [Chloroflexi bacterium]|nr:hypothetical protein [Chloroflexota bacterium]